MTKKTDKILYKNLRDEAITISAKAARLLKSLQSKVKVHKMKDLRDLSTNADLEAEDLICREITKLHPDHNILSEEAGFLNKTGDFTWIIDPLDGTQNYVGGLNDYSVLISIEHKNFLVLGVTNLISENKIFSCIRDNGSFLRDIKLKVSHISNLANARIVLYALRSRYGTALMKKNILLYKKLISITYKTSVNDFDAKQLAFVAFGCLDGHIRTTSGGGWWDVAAGILLVEEAGGKVTDFNGNPVTKENFKHDFIASNGLIHDQLLQVVNKSI